MWQLWSHNQHKKKYISQHLESLTRNLPSQWKVNDCVVDKFTYLGSTLSRVVHIDDEVDARIAKASADLASYVEVFGTEVESDLTQSWKYIDR